MAVHTAAENLHSMEFVQKQHAETLSSLHAEVSLLRQKNSELSFQLLGLESVADELAEARRTVAELTEREKLLLLRAARAADADARIEQLTALLAERDKTVQSLEEALERSNAVVLDHEARANELEADLAQRSKLQRVKLQYKETVDAPAAAADNGDGPAQAVVPPLRPSPPKKPFARLGTKQLYRRASYTNVQQVGDGRALATRFNRNTSQPSPNRISPEPVGELPAYPEPVPPIGGGANNEGALTR